MGASIRIALDVMGGDHGPPVVIAGAALALVRHPGIKFILFGDRAQIAPVLDAYPSLKARSSVEHTDIAVAMHEKPSQALRHGRWKSSMWMALEAVKNREADAAVSAGNTGALMAMAKFCLKTLPGIERPAIAAIWPTISSECIVLDVGANVGADAMQLVDFAGMGAALARALFHVERPSIGLLNIGVEEVKGLEEIKRAGAALKRADLPIAYHGFVEGDDLGRGTVDVVVTEGFSGNIALKTAEGTAKQIGEYLRAAMRRSLLARLGALLAQGAFRALKAKMDPNQMNGGMFLGLNGIVIKSHGGADAVGIAAAIDLAHDMAAGKLVESIGKDVQRFQNALHNGDEKVHEVTR